MHLCSPLTSPPPQAIESQQISDVYGNNVDESISEGRKKEKAKAQKLLTILKNIDKKSAQISESEMRLKNEEALHLLLEFQLKLSHNQGLFGGDESRAQFLLASTSGKEGTGSNTKKINANGGKQKKRGVSGIGVMDINAVRKAIFVVDSVGPGNSTKNQNNSICEENLLLASLGRAIGVGKSKEIDVNRNKENDVVNPTDQSKVALAVVEVAADCITSMCEQTKQHLGSMSSESQFCAKTELEIYSVMGTQWLNCLISKIQECLHIMDPTASYFGINDRNKNQQNKRLPSSHTATASNTASSCLKAAASIVTLIGTRLSRSTQSVADLHSIAWRALGSGSLQYDDQISCNHDIMISASALVSALPLTGNSGFLQMNANFNHSLSTNNSSPPKLWTEAIKKSLNALTLLLKSAYRYKNISNSQSSSTTEKGADWDGWLQKLRNNTVSQMKRTCAIHMRVEGLKCIILSLLNMEGYIANDNNQEVFVKCCLPLQSLLKVCELLVKFGQGAESKYLSSKNSTIRDTIAEDGYLLAPSSIIYLTNPMRYTGYEIFHSLMKIAGSTATSPLLNQANLITELIYYGISTTSSLGVQRHFHRLPSKRQRQWLNNSIVLRMKAIESMRVGCLALGSACASSTVMGKSAIMVAACLLEQFHHCGNNTGNEVQWCSTGEQAALAVTAAETISVFISVGGGYIHSTVRSTLESTISSCLSMILPSTKSLMANGLSLTLQNSQMKVALLQLASNVITVPWQDGGMSTLTTKIQQVSRALRFDRDTNVVAVALSTLNICSIVITPRSAPLSIESTRKITDSLNGLSNALATSRSASSFPISNKKSRKLSKNTDTKQIEPAMSKIRDEASKQVDSNETNTAAQNVPTVKSIDNEVLMKTSQTEKETSDKKRKRINDLSDSQKVEPTRKILVSNVPKDTSLKIERKIAIEPNKSEEGKENIDDSKKENTTETKFEIDQTTKVEKTPMDSETNDKEDESSREESDEDSDGSFPEIIDSDPDEDDL